MNPDLQNKIELEALKEYPLGADSESKRDKHIYLRCGFRDGAKFVTGILQDEIDELKRSNVNLFDTVCDFERGIECLQSDRTKLENQLSEANATIQSLKDENGRIREALGLFEKELKIGSDGTNLKCTCSRENCHSLWLSAGDIIYRVSYVHSEKLKALTQKAEE